MHLTHAKDQRAYIKQVLRTEAERVLPEMYRERGIEEFNACLDRWVCNHESDTSSHELFVSNKHEKLLASVSLQVPGDLFTQCIQRLYKSPGTYLHNVYKAYTSPQGLKLSYIYIHKTRYYTFTHY